MSGTEESDDTISDSEVSDEEGAAGLQNGATAPEAAKGARASSAGVASLTQAVAASEGGSGAGAGEEAQMLVMNSERFMVPEVLFQPSEVGLLGQGGVHQVVAEVCTVICDARVRTMRAIYLQA
jgi:hypothetical protein